MVPNAISAVWATMGLGSVHRSTRAHCDGLRQGGSIPHRIRDGSGQVGSILLLHTAAAARHDNDWGGNIRECWHSHLPAEGGVRALKPKKRAKVLTLDLIHKWPSSVSRASTRGP